MRTTPRLYIENALKREGWVLWIGGDVYRCYSKPSETRDTHNLLIVRLMNKPRGVWLSFASYEGAERDIIYRHVLRQTDHEKALVHYMNALRFAWAEAYRIASRD